MVTWEPWCPAQSWERGRAKGLLDVDHELEDGAGTVCVLGTRDTLDWLKPAEADVTSLSFAGVAHFERLRSCLVSHVRAILSVASFLMETLFVSSGPEQPCASEKGLCPCQRLAEKRAKDHSGH